MSNKPNPVAETAALLMDLEHMESFDKCRKTLSAYAIASLASRLHRIAPAAQWVSEAACGLDDPHAEDYCHGVSLLEDADTFHTDPARLNPWERYAFKRAKRTHDALSKLATELEPLGIRLTWGGDPRGASLTLIYDGNREYHISAKGR